MTPTSPQLKEYTLTDDVSFIRSKTMNCKGCESNTCAEVCQLWQQAHDTAIRNATLDEFAKNYSGRTVDDAIREYRRFHV